MKQNKKTAKKNLLDFSFDFELLEECPLCAHKVLIPNSKVLWLNMDFWYNVCARCGLKFMNPRPTQKSYQDFYKNLFWEQKVANIGFHMPGQMWNTKRYAWDSGKIHGKKKGTEIQKEKHKALRFRMVDETLKHFLKLGKESDVLEVGCGFGVTLEELHKKYGSRVYAVEPSLEAQKIMREGAVIHTIGNYAEDLEKLKNKKQKFDAIIFSHSLENTVYPLQVITWAKKCLKKNGVIYIQLSNMLTFDQMNPYHPYIFSAHSLSFLAKKAGMKPIRAGEQLHRMLTMVLKK